MNHNESVNSNSNKLIPPIRVSGAYTAVCRPGDLLPEDKRPKSLSLGSLLDLQLREREHLVLPWLRQAESAMVYAAPGVGKSLFSLSLALGVAGGGTVIGKWKAPKARRVLLVDGEMPTDDIQSRMKMLLTAAGEGMDLEAARKNLYIQARQHQHFGAQFTDLSNPDSRETLLDAARRGKVELVILDNLSTLATVDDENDAGQFNDTIKFLLRLKQAGIACLLVHHANKTGASYRGSSKIATTFEVIMRLEEVARKATDRADTTRFRLTWDKFRGKREEGTGVPLDVALETTLFEDRSDKAGCTVENAQTAHHQWICTLAEDTRIEQLLELVRSGEYRNMRDLAEALGVSLNTISRWKATAITTQLITEEQWLEYLPGNRKHKAGSAGVEDEPDF